MTPFAMDDDPAKDILGIDVGGTFTDFVLLRGGTLHIHKLPGSPDNPSRAMLAGIADLGAPALIVHGTTVATNALLERRGAHTALLTTAGFADVLTIGRGTRSALYDLDVEAASPLVPASLRLEVAERLAPDGTVLLSLDETGILAAARQLVAAGVEAVAVCFLHSYANPAHEERAAALLEEAAREHSVNDTGNSDSKHPRFFVCHSAAVSPEYREYERTSTTVVNAYVGPILDHYLGSIEQELARLPATPGDNFAHAAPHLHIMASDGGRMTTHSARRLGARTTLSGPAGGVVGALATAQQAGFEHIISFDMGGTSTDVALCNGRIPETNQTQVGGLPVRFPGVDIHTVGAGGGSLARVDMGGALRVGPQSAGATPGPACYGRGTLPTLTDANLLLGRLRADHFLGGQMHLDSERAQAALDPLAQQLGLDSTTTALGIVRVANAAVERAIRAISVERGIDPRSYTLVAFGGAGPLHAPYLARALGMERVLVPRYPGVLSALGMISTDMTRDYARFLGQPLANLSPALLLRDMEHLAEQASSERSHDATQSATSTTTTSLRGDWILDLRYIGQSHELRTPLATWEQMQPFPPDLEQVAQRFHLIHQQRSGYAMPEHPIEVVALRLKCSSTRKQPPPPESSKPTPSTSEAPPPPCAWVRAALAAEAVEWSSAALYEREKLQPGARLTAPAIVIQLDTTIIIPSGWSAQVDRQANLVLSLTSQSSDNP